MTEGNSSFSTESPSAQQAEKEFSLMPNSLKCHVKAVKSLLSKTEMSYLLVFTRTEHLQKVSSPKIGGYLGDYKYLKDEEVGGCVKSVSDATFNFWLSFHLFICC